MPEYSRNVLDEMHDEGNSGGINNEPFKVPRIKASDIYRDVPKNWILPNGLKDWFGYKSLQ